MKRASHYNIQRLVVLFRMLILAGLVGLPWGNSFAQGVELNKMIEKSFPVNSQSVLEVINKYGKIHVNTTDGSTANIKVLISSTANKEYRAQERLDEVEIVERVFGNTIQLESIIPQGNLSQRAFNRGVSVSYEIDVPRSVVLNLNNKFNDVYLDDRSADVKVNLSYGKLIAGKLDGAWNNLKQEFGDMDISFIRGGDINFSFGQIEIGRADDISLTTKTANISINKASRIDLDSDMGKTEIHYVDEISGNISSALFELEELGKRMDLAVKYAPAFRIDMIRPEVEEIRLTGNMTPFHFHFSPDAKFELNSSIEFGNLRFDNEPIVMERKEKNLTIYSGEFGPKSNVSRVGTRPTIVVIKSKYGNVKISR